MRHYTLLLALPALLAAALVAHGATLQFQLEANATIPFPVKAAPHCVLPLGGSKVLIAGYTGAPPRAYAAIVDIRAKSVTPLAVPGLEGSVRSEVMGCTSSPAGPILYGYVQYRNDTLRAMIWVYRGGELHAVPLNKVTVMPLYMLLNPPYTYIVGFVGSCQGKGVVSLAYVLQGSLEELLGGRIRGRVYMPGIRAENNTIYQILGDKLYHCVYFTGAYILPTGDVEVVGYALNGTFNTGFDIRLDPLFQVVESLRLEPVLPIVFAKAGDKGVGVGYMLGGGLGVIVYLPDGKTHVARVNYQGLGTVYVESLSCQETMCVAGGFASGKQAKRGIIMLVGIASNGTVEYANIFEWRGVDDVPAVYLSPTGLLYLSGVGNGELHLLVLRVATVAQAQQATGTGTANAGGASTMLYPLPVLASAAAFIAVVAAAIVLLARRGARR